MSGPLEPESFLASSCSPTVTGTPINIASAIVIAIIIVSRDLYLPTYHIGQSVFGPRLDG